MTYRWKYSSLKDRKKNFFKEYSNYVFNKEEMRNIDISQIVKRYSDIDFSDSVFEEDIIFDNYEFYGDVIFENTIFKKNVSFKNCTFNGDCIFINIDFNEGNKVKKIFIKSKFKGQHLIFKNIKNMPRLDGMKFSSCSKLILEDLKFRNKDYEYAKLIYRIARNQANSIGDYERVGHYYYLERYYGGKTIKREKFNTTGEYLSNKCFDILSRYTIGYGEKPFNIFIISFFIISLFALLYMITGIRSTSDTFIKMYIDAWYFSMATFSTVGYGDIVVTTYSGKILASIEVFLGVTMAASWASVIIKRMSR